MGRRGGRGGTPAARKAAARGARGIFGKAAEDLFRLSKKDGKRVDFLRPNARTRARPANYTLPKDRGGKRGPRVHSTKAGKDQQDLINAVKSARLRNKDDGGNYAAFRYIDKNGNEGILVARSGIEDGDKFRMGGPHSERQGGAFLLEQMQKGNVLKVTEVYTERSPCNTKNRWCDEWLYEHFQKNDPHFKVTHTEWYDDKTKDTANANLRKYARNLLKQYGKI